MFAGLLQDNILRQPEPEKQIPWLDIIKREDPGMYYEVTDFYAAGELMRAKEADSIYERYIGYNRYLERDHVEESYAPSVEPEVAETILEEITLKGRRSTRVPGYVRQMSKLLRLPSVSKAKGKLKPKELLRQAAMHGDTIGKRLAQLAWLYADQQILDVFGDMFDEAGNTSIVLIMRSLLAEWPDFWDYVEEPIHMKVAEGSMGAVIRVTPQAWFAKKMEITGDIAIKVMTPNPDYHAEAVHDLLNSAFTKLAKQDSDYEAALLLIGDTFRWIKADYNFESALESDAIFRKLYQGHALSGSPYSIHMPRSIMASKVFMLEEFIEDTINLTKPDRLKAANINTRQVMQLVVADYIYQIKNGFIHSNLNPGNIAVKPDSNQVVYFDRGYILDMTKNPAEKDLLLAIVGNLDNLSAIGPVLMNYVMNQNVLDFNALAGLLPDIVSIANSEKDPTAKLAKVIIILRRAGIEIPLEISLLVLNLGYLDRLCKQYGFADGFIEAYATLEK
jgi:hypothetical protein